MSLCQLRVASSYSLRHGTAPPAALVAAAAARGQPMAALTDRDGVHGAAEHLSACASAGLDPLLGTDLGLASPEGGRVVLLARGAAGWASVCALVTAAHSGGGPVAITPDQVAHHPQGLVVLLGPDSDVGRLLAQGRPGRAAELLHAWRATGAQVALAPHDHGAPGQRQVARDLLRLGDAERVLVVLTNAVRYPDPAGAPVAWALDRIRAHAPGPFEAGPRVERAHLATGQEMLEVAAGVCAGDQTRARRLLAHTQALATSCVLDPVADLGWGRLHLPDRPGARAELRIRVAEGAARLGLDQGSRASTARERAAHELDIIDRMGLWSYFLTVADAAAAIRARGIRCSARGSAVGSLVVHLLGISAIDPLEHGLLMERFCTPSRPGQPDIDLDVESARRLEAYDAVIDSHPGQSAAVSMMETYRARSALRDAGMALSLPAVEVHRLASALPRVRAARIRQTLAELPELRHLQSLDATHVEKLVSLAERLDGLPQHVAMHPCGLVLSDEGMGARMPTQPSRAGYPMVHADKHGVEDWGLLKLDVLGVRMQSALARASDELERTTGTRPDLEALPDADPDTAHLMATSNTTGCFQIESPGQRELLSRLRPATVDDLVADISLFRPGPVGSDMVSMFLGARDGTPATLPHPVLEPILAPTGGALLWHEQLLKVLDAITGCGLDRAEALRRALDTDVGRDQVETEVRLLAEQRGHAPAVVDQVWEMVEAFGAFGFCRAHAAAFAVPTYQSAYLKTHHPAALFAGLLTHDPGMYPRRVLVHEARRSGVPVLGVDVNASGALWQMEEAEGGVWGVRAGLVDVPTLTDDHRTQLLAGRPFADLGDLLARTDLDGEALDDLILAGGADSLTGSGGGGRRQLMIAAHAHHRTTRRTRGGGAGPAAGQLTLTTAPVPGGGAVVAGPVAAAMTPAEQRAEELRVLGYETTGHLLDAHVGALADLAAHHRLASAARLAHLPDGAPVTVAGVRISVQTPPTRSGRRVVFATLEDRTGLVDIALFEGAQQQAARVLFEHRLVIAAGRVRRSTPHSLPTVTVTRAWPLAAHLTGGEASRVAA